MGRDVTTRLTPGDVVLIESVIEAMGRVATVIAYVLPHGGRARAECERNLSGARLAALELVRRAGEAVPDE